jgi:SAM-dependent methyltransferase
LKRANKLPAGRRVVEIGAQQLSNEFVGARDKLAELCHLFGASPPELGGALATESVAGLELLPDAAPASRIFWETLGFAYAAVEYAGHRDAIALDLNKDSVPHKLKRSFDIVINTGTTEHVADQANAFQIIHDLTAPGGLMFHDVPAGGMMTHGFFGYNMQFFFMLCRDNNYEVVDLGLVYCGSAKIHSDILASNAQFSRMATHFDPYYSLPIGTEFMVPNFMIRAIIRKVIDQHYITPLDLPADLIVPRARYNLSSILKWLSKRRS